MRKLATVRIIDEVRAIEGADRIVAYRVGGWWVVDQKDAYAVGDTVIYAEPDSWIPHELAPFLSKGKEPREFEGVKGERLRTMKMKGQLSQGLLLPMSKLIGQVDVDTDVTDTLGILKWEKPINPQMQGKVRGNFPSFIRKTDQERIQNLSRDLERWSNDARALWVVEEKLDGTSCTIYRYENRMGVCSRNYDLDYDPSNLYWQMALKYGFAESFENSVQNLAFQGEIIGPGIQGNKYGLTEPAFYLFDVYDIDKQEYIDMPNRLAYAYSFGLHTVPILASGSSIAGATMDKMLDIANGKSVINNNVLREGLVFKQLRNPDVSFKVVSNEWLLTYKE